MAEHIDGIGLGVSHNPNRCPQCPIKDGVIENQKQQLAGCAEDMRMNDITVAQLKADLANGRAEKRTIEERLCVNR